MQILKSFGKITYKALYDTIHHDGVEHAGYIAFLSVLSVFPFLVFFFAAAGFIGETEIGTRFIQNIINNTILPSHVMAALTPRIREIVSGPPQSLLTISIIGAIWTASSMVEGLRTILNRAYRVNTPPAYIWRRLLSVGQFLVLTGLIIFVTFLLVITPNILSHMESVLAPELWEQIRTLFNNITDYETSGTTTPYWESIRYLVTSFILFCIVVASYFILPNIKQTWDDIAPGALYVVILWSIAGALFSLYMSHFKQVSVIYGSLGGVIAALLFFYICAMIYVFGAEFNYHVAKARGHRIQQREDE